MMLITTKIINKNVGNGEAIFWGFKSKS